MKTSFSITNLVRVLSFFLIGLLSTTLLMAQNWYDLSWQYRRPVTVANPGGTALTDYQVMITLTNTIFDFSSANIDGSDVRITDADGTTPIPFWIEDWDAGLELARVWVKIPSIPSGGSTAYLYYGNPAANTESDGNSTFNLFDDTTWVSTAGNLNPVQVATQSWWESQVSFPIVFEDNSFAGRPRFHMIYDGHFVIGHAKGYTTSPDLVNWTAYDNGLSGSARINPVMGVGYAGNSQFAWGDLIKVGSTYHMFPSSGPGTTVHCQSTDLIHWTNQSGSSATFDALSSNDPSGIGTGVAILKEADGKTPIIVDNKYWMVYFHGFSGGSMYMAYAEISDLLTWTTCYSGSPVLIPSGWEGGQLWTPSFVGIGDTYYMYYQAGSPYRIGFASAPDSSGGSPLRPDNTTWTKSPNNPVITNTHGWDNGFCQDPVLRCFDGVYYVFYTGDPPWTNGFVYSDSPEGPWTQYGQSAGGVNWTKTGSPAVSNGIITFSAGEAIQSPISYSPGNAVGFRANFGTQGGSEIRWGGFINGTGSTGNDRAMIQKTTLAPSTNYLYLSTHPTYTQFTDLDNQFHVYEVLWGSGRADAVLDHGATSIYTMNNVPSISLPLSFYNYSGSNSLQLDWVFERQYSSPEPTSGVGTEETPCPDPPGVNSPVNYCQDDVSVPLTATGTNLLWYTMATGGTGSPVAPTPSTSTPGTTNYYVSQTLYGCESDRAQIDVIVNETPGTPIADITQPSCTVSTGIITVTSSVTGLTFSIDGTDYSNTTGVFTDVSPGNYNLTAKNSYDCISPNVSIEIIAFPGSPAAPSADITQPTCTVATGIITVTSSTSGLSFSIDGVDYTNTTGTFTDVEPGIYNLTAKNSGGCISPGTSVTVDPAPETPDAPVADVTQPTCIVTTGTITVTSATSGLSFSIDGVDYTNATGTFTDVEPGSYNLTAKNSSDCISLATMISVEDIPPPPTGTIASVNSNICYGDPYYQLQLTAATGQPPYTLVVDGVTSASVSIGQIFSTVNVSESIWNNSTTGISGPAGGNEDWEVGVKFRTAVNGYIRGIRFHKAPANTGTHVGSLWTSTGTKLASATFTNETSSGWQEVLFDTPVAVVANTVYVASYSDPAGNFSWNANYFSSSGVTSGNLYALSTNDAPAGNGVYNTDASAFPNLTALDANYWVDVVFSISNGSSPLTINPQLTSITTSDGCTNTGSPLSSTSVTINVTPEGTISSAGTFCENSDMSLIFNATEGTSPFSLEINGINYNGISSGIPFSVGTTGSNQAQTIWPVTATGSDQQSNSTNPIEMGVKFRANVSGQITGIRFYKRAAQTGTFTGTLWSASGTNLATETFTSVSSSGWQQVDFTTPVSIEPNITYVASYHAPNGNFPADQNYFSNSGVTNGALTALQAGVDGGNGVYIYSSSIAFPNLTYNNTNYWVDVVFVPDANSYFELTSITSNNGCIESGNPINAVSVPVYTISVSPSSISGSSIIDAGTSTTLSVAGGSLGYNATWEWYSGSCAGTFVGTGTSITVSPLETTDYFVRAEGDCNTTDCAQLTVTVTHPETLWTGSSGQDWSESGNWNNGVPESFTNVIIPSAPSNQPHVTAPTVSPAQCRNLTIDADATLTIDPGKALSVIGNLVNNAGNTGLVILSDATGTGSLIESSIVNATVSRYLNNDTWHYIASPVDDPLAGIFLGMYLMKWDEPSGEWNYIVNPDLVLSTDMEGFAVWTNNIGTVDFTGNLNTGPKSINTTNTVAAVHNNKGFNFVGNPFPSSLDWDVDDGSGWSRTAGYTDLSLYIWNGAVGNYGVYVKDGGFGTNDVDNIIPPHQGFFVHTSASTGFIGVDNGARVHAAKDILKSVDSDEPLLILRVDGNGYADETLFRIDEQTTIDYDNMNDAVKYRGIPEAPQLYSLSRDNQELSVNSFPNSEEYQNIPVGFEAGAEGNYFISVKKLIGFETAHIFLEDLLRNNLIQLDNNTVYSFTANPQIEAERFILHLNATEIDDVELNSNIFVYSLNGLMYVSLPENTGYISVYNIIGQVVAGVTVHNRITEIPIGRTGTYIVRVMSQDQIIVKKAFVK